MQAAAADAKRAPDAIERPPVWVTSSPSRPARATRPHSRLGQRAAAHRGVRAKACWCSIRSADSDLGDRIRLTQGWREFTLYRAVPQTGELTVTFALTGLGEASIDDLAVQSARSRAHSPAVTLM